MRTSHPPLLRPILLLQVALLTVNALEATFFATIGFATPVPALLTWAAVVTVGDAARRARYPRRLRVVEWLIITFGLIDTAISVFLAGGILEPMALLSRFAIPISVILMTRRANARASSVDHHLDEPVTVAVS